MYEIVASDLDGVATETISSWQAMHAHFGCLASAEENYQKYRDNHEKWMLVDWALWEKASGGAVNREMLQQIIGTPTLRPHAKEVFQYLKSKYIVYLLTQAIDVHADAVAEQLGIDSKHIIVDRFMYDTSGKPTGVDPSNYAPDKGVSIERIAEKEGISTREIIAIGDTPFDQPMFDKAGLSIVVNNGKNQHMMGRVNHYVYDLTQLIPLL